MNDDLDQLDLADLLELLADLHERDPHAVRIAIGQVAGTAILCGRTPAPH